ncbi:MAG TPA: ATP-grasp domain-containing protein [Methylotenera sp.]|nr:ATP-grasp domain-containing protein [Methylotenera sp.]
MKSKSILIIALSARPFVKAAKRAGYKVTAIDAFADQQTVDVADKTIVIDYDEYGFNADALLAAVSALELNQYTGFVYGSGFDAQPELLQQLANLLPLIGNTPSTVSAIKMAASFFAALNELNLLFPDINHQLSNADINATHLQKFAGGCGGTHIRFADIDTELMPNHYYQQYVKGRSVSLLFIANSEEVNVIGFNEQWLSPTLDMPFQYGGAVSHVLLAQKTQQQLIDAATKLTKKFGLIGLNSLDAVIQNAAPQDDLVYVLEINPRLSATFDLYDDAEFNLFDLHLDACLQKSKFNSQPVLQAVKTSKAHAIVYAASDIQVSASFDWSDWVVDTPHFPTKQPATRFETIKILANQPICTVTAYASQAEDSKQLAQTRAKIVVKMLQAQNSKYGN